MSKWQFMGDVNLEYGGTFYDFSNWEQGYVDAIVVTDLDSACGFNGAIMIESISILVDRKENELASALSCIGAKFLENGNIEDNGKIISQNENAYQFVLAYACQSYGYYDTDQTQTEILQLDKDGPMEFDGWEATKRLRSNANLRNYVKKHFLY